MAQEGDVDQLEGRTAVVTGGRAVVGGIRENRLHVFTHPDSMPLVEQRFEHIRADYAAEAAARRARG